MGYIFEIHRFLKSKDIMLHDNEVAKQTLLISLFDRVDVLEKNCMGRNRK